MDSPLPTEGNSVSNSDNDFEKIDNHSNNGTGSGLGTEEEDMYTSNHGDSLPTIEPSSESPGYSDRPLSMGKSEHVPETLGPMSGKPDEKSEPSVSSPSASKPKRAISVGCAVSIFSKLDSRVLDLIYWKDVRKTGIVFGTGTALLLATAICSILSVCSYLSLAILSITMSFRVYKTIIGAVQKSGDAHPFKAWLDKDLKLPEEKVNRVAEIIVENVTCTAKCLRRLFLVEDLVDSLKFGLLLWVFTYIGAWFSGMSLLLLGYVGVFTLPKFYETYKTQIDEYMGIACTQLCNIKQQIIQKLPFPAKKKAEEKVEKTE